MMKFGAWVCGAGILAVVGGCSGVPQLDVPSGLTVAHIIDKIQCEVWEARRTHKGLRDKQWTVVANLTLQVDDSVGLTPTVRGFPVDPEVALMVSQLPPASVLASAA